MEDKAIFIAEAGLYQLVKNEEILMTTAMGYDCSSIEKEFEKMVESAVENYHSFNATVLSNPTDLNTEIMVNFDEFFEYVLDVKKTMKEKEALSTVAAIVASANVSAESGHSSNVSAEMLPLHLNSPAEVPAKSSKNKKK